MVTAQVPARDGPHEGKTGLGIARVFRFMECVLTLKRLIRTVHPLQGFIYEDAHFFDGPESGIIEVRVRERKGSRGRCPETGKPRPSYDRMEERSWEFIPLWGLKVMLRYAPRRVLCADGSVRMEALPWSRGKGQLCAVFQLHLARWAKRLSWKETAELFRVGWGQVAAAVQWVVDHGLRHRSLAGMGALGMDEVHLGKKLGYWSVIYQIDEGRRRLLYAAKGRCSKVLGAGLKGLGEQALASVRFVCTDLGKAVLKAARKYLPGALNVLDRFHVRNLLSEAIDKTRRAEAAELRRAGKKPVLKGGRFALLKKRSNWTRKQKGLMAQILGMNLKSVRAFLLIENFEHFWGYRTWTWAQKFLRNWCAVVMRTRIETLKTAARTLLGHEPLLHNYFIAKKEISNAAVEGLNGRIKLTLRKSYGFRS
jgi:transposase